VGCRHVILNQRFRTPARVLFASSVLALTVTACSSASLAPSAPSGTEAESIATRVSAESAHALAKGFTVLYSFQAAPDGTVPLAGVILDKAGDIFGTTSTGGALGNGAVFELKHVHKAYTESVLHSFASTDGTTPIAAPFEDASGDLFAAASAGGGSSGYGTLVELSPQKKGYGETGLFAFDFADGANPEAGFFDASGALYTTAFSGGADSYGDIVKASASGLSATDVYDFQGPPDGASPDSSLVADAGGALYGTTYYGGNGSCPQGEHLFYHCGVVFKFVPSGHGGAESVLYMFQGGNDGADPYDGVVLDNSGNIYGTTIYGGDTNCGNRGSPNGCGTVFKLTPQQGGGYKESILYSFKGSADGQYPYGGLTAKGDTLYGTTEFGGGSTACAIGCGTIFKLTESGKGYAVVHSFQSTDGANPQAGLSAKGSALYGTTAGGGSAGNGVVFEFVP